MPESSDLATQLHTDFQGYAGRIREEARTMRKQRESVGPRRRAKIRGWLMNQDIEQAMPLIQQLQGVAKHELGEQSPCAACKFLGGE